VRIAVTGATGFIGRALCRELGERGHNIVAMTRDTERARRLLPDVGVVAWDGSPEVLPEVDAVVHLAGERVAGRWSTAKKAGLRESRIGRTRQLVEAMARAPRRADVLVSASAVGYYGDRGEATLTERSGPGQDFLSQLCEEWETEAQRAEMLGIRVVRLRFGVVLGRTGGALAGMLPLFRLGAGGPIGSGQQWFPWVHLADAVGLIRLALGSAEASGPINVVAPGLVRNGEFTRALGRAVHRPAVLPAPAFPLRLALGQFAETLLGSQRVLPERAEALSYAFTYPEITSALRSIISGKEVARSAQ
jgi:uncharacterized protein (TIGR01777 family)